MTDEELLYIARTLGKFLGIAAHLKDCKELGICPDYLGIEQRMIELYEADKLVKEKYESAN